MNIIKFLNKYVYEKHTYLLCSCLIKAHPFYSRDLIQNVLEVFGQQQHQKQKIKKNTFRFVLSFYSQTETINIYLHYTTVRTSFFTGRNNIYVLFFTNEI